MQKAAATGCGVEPINCPCCPGDCCNISDMKSKANTGSKLDPQDPEYAMYADAVKCFDEWTAMSKKYQDCSKTPEKCTASFTIDITPEADAFAGKCEMTELIGGSCVSISGDNPYKKPC